MVEAETSVLGPPDREQTCEPVSSPPSAHRTRATSSPAAEAMHSNQEGSRSPPPRVSPISSRHPLLAHHQARPMFDHHYFDPGAESVANRARLAAAYDYQRRGTSSIFRGEVSSVRTSLIPACRPPGRPPTLMKMHRGKFFAVDSTTFGPRTGRGRASCAALIPPPPSRWRANC